MQSLSVKYRPKEFSECLSQESIIKILEKQLETNHISNAMLFCGPSGCGKTTLARIFADKLNGGCGSPIEIDAASNSGVENVRAIVKEASERSLSGLYKVYILDECHSFSNTGWQAWLKCIEEPPQYTVFIFCTTDPQKIPPTILNRVMRFNLTRISHVDIANRLRYICMNEGFTEYEDCCNYLSRICNGGMRDGISLLEKCSKFSTCLSMQNVITALGNYSYEVFFNLCDALVDGNEQSVFSIISSYYDEGNDLRLFVSQFMDFCIDVSKYALFKDIQVTKIPTTLLDRVKYATNFDSPEKYYFYVLDKLLELKYNIRNEVDVKTTVLVVLLQIARGVK